MRCVSWVRRSWASSHSMRRKWPALKWTFEPFRTVKMIGEMRSCARPIPHETLPIKPQSLGEVSNCQAGCADGLCTGIPPAAR